MRFVQKLPKETKSPSNIYVTEENSIFKMYLLPTAEFNTLYRNFGYPDKEIDYYVRIVNGLVYESNIYAEVIDKIVNHNISPNFLVPLDWYEHNQKLVHFLIETNDVVIPDSDRFQVNNGHDLTNYCLSEPITFEKMAALRRVFKELALLSVPPIKKINSIFKEITELMNSQTTYSFLGNESLVADIVNILALTDELRVVGSLTERIPQSMKLGNLFLNLARNRNDDIHETKNILFQLIAGLYVMNAIGLQHNDLHLNNIMVKVLPQPIKLQYSFQYMYQDRRVERKYIMETIFIVKFFDWDIAYAGQGLMTSMQFNPKIESDFFRKTGVLNRVIPFFDVYTLSCMLNNLVNKYPNTSLAYLRPEVLFFSADNLTHLDSIFANHSALPNSDLVFTHDGFLCRANINIERLPSLYNSFDHMVEIIARSAKLEQPGRDFDLSLPVYDLTDRILENTLR